MPGGGAGGYTKPSNNDTGFPRCGGRGQVLLFFGYNIGKAWSNRVQLNESLRDSLIVQYEVDKAVKLFDELDAVMNGAVMRANKYQYDAKHLDYLAANVTASPIKPQVFRATPPTPQRGKKTVVSVMAGIRVAQMRATFPNSFTVIRVMPNLGLSVGEGATAIASDGLTEASLQLAESIFQSCGKTVRVTEDLIDAVTGVSGSGPMYVFEFVEALTQGGVDAGLTRETAYELALQTVKGSAKILENSTDAPQTWSARVRSPGGTTAEAQKVLEAGNFHDLVNRAVQAAVRRSKELSG